MTNSTTRSVCLIESAIDRLIEYGDRIHAVSHKYHPDQRRRKYDTSRHTSGASPQSAPVTIPRTSDSSSFTTGTVGDSVFYMSSFPVNINLKSLQVTQTSRGLESHSINTRSCATEKETVSSFLYKVTKGGRKCTIPGKVCNKALTPLFTVCHRLKCMAQRNSPFNIDDITDIKRMVFESDSIS
ncbi:hypothetical protein DICVIV_08384 [Dictyocaulus viviparus]|uniref:Uncharacterized protein n=1 Tax=Dictyocaulus viviparus TaxID=29172 RepID=A0A0D8XM09_DICVI|nr:hypothetical protein DICVIV_08384 [Dictyocaulus viviparus]